MTRHYNIVTETYLTLDLVTLLWMKTDQKRTSTTCIMTLFLPL